MFAVPAATAVTKPADETVAAAVLELDHEIVRPDKVFPFASLSTAAACVVCPVVRLDELSVTVTEATGAGGGGGAVVLVTPALPIFPSLVALMVALPAASALTSPAADTEAMVGAELLHVIVRSVTTAPVESLTTAVACVVPPTCSEEAARETLTEPMGILFTTIVALASTPSAFAVTLAFPTRFP
jgi:hypothetical protein